MFISFISIKNRIFFFSLNNFLIVFSIHFKAFISNHSTSIFKKIVSKSLNSSIFISSNNDTFTETTFLFLKLYTRLPS
ncbi:TPA: hypothetical protein DEG21_01680 [Patescibacteria group bacterium]|nr:hypothetical protein [Candidatus Gracilibacteria bacterium]HBY74599.1 hypothetical protein [Candidatus Gracilibacteria bacterium]